MRRVNRNHLADHEPIEQHADAGKVLLNGRRREPMADLLYIGSDVNRPHLTEAAHPLLLAPFQKFHGGPIVGRARIRIANVDGEEFKKARTTFMFGYLC